VWISGRRAAGGGGFIYSVQLNNQGKQ